MDTYEDTLELRKFLTEADLRFMDVPQNGFRRTCWKIGDSHRYFYLDDYGYASYFTCACSGKEAIEVSQLFAQQALQRAYGKANESVE